MYSFFDFSDGNVESGCKKYYQCIFFGTVWEMYVDRDCPTGTLFDSVNTVCNWPHLITCKA